MTRRPRQRAAGRGAGPGHVAAPARTTAWALLLIAAHVALASWAACRNSVTFDENFHVPAGVAIVAYRDFNGSVAQPPAAKALFGLAALAAGARPPARSAITGDEFTIGRSFSDLNRDRYARVFLAARAVVILLSALLAWLVWRFASRLHGPRGGLLALAAYAFAPEALAHAGIAGIDLPFALGTTASVAAFWHFARSGRWRWFAVTALAVGLTFATRFNAAVLGVAFGLIALLGMWLGRVRHPARLWTGIALLPLTSLLALNLAYLGQTPLRPLRDLPVRSQSFQALRERMPGLRLPLPEAALAGIDYLALLATPGERVSYLLGQARRGPVWSYFPLALVLKWPLGLLGLIALRIGTSVARRASARRRWNEAFVLVPAAVVLGAAMFAQVNAGVRYLLPLLPLLCIWSGGLLAPGTGVRRGRAARAVPALAIALVLLAGIEGLRALPYPLSSFNAVATRLGRPEFLLNDSNVDWGQGLIALRDELRERGIRRVHLAYHGTTDPVRYGIDYVPYQGGQPGTESDWLAISSYYFVGLGQRMVTPSGRTAPIQFDFRAFWAREPEARPAGCMVLFRIR